MLIPAMRRWLALLGCALTLAACATAPAPDELARQLKRQGDAWDAAIVAKDLPAVAANMTPDFRHIRDNGAQSNGAEFLAFIGSPKLVIDPYQVEDFDLRVYGQVALLSGRTRMTGRYDGVPFKSHYRYIDVYVRDAAGWRVASVQITPMPE